jgi:uncharacterized membrane protein
MNELKTETSEREIERSAIPSRVLYALAVLAAIAVAADFLYTKSPAFAWQGWAAFYGGFAFAACIVFALIARVLRRLLARPEDYYER